MTHHPQQTLHLVPENAGHAYACFGLFELAHRLSPRDAIVTAMFSQDDTRFHISGSTLAIPAILNELSQADVAVSIDYADESGKPDDKGIVFKFSNGERLVVDWWVDDGSLKTWAGAQSILSIVLDEQRTLAELCRCNQDFENALEWNASLRNPDDKNQAEPGSTYFNSRLSGVVDMGFSLDILGVRPKIYPVVELLALIGLQRFRPTFYGEFYRYYTWHKPLSILVASAAASGLLDADLREWHFQIVKREAKGYYKVFGTAYSIS